MFVVALLCLGLYLFFGDAFRQGMTACAIIIWTGFLVWVNSSPLLRSRLPRFAGWGLLIGGLIVASAFGSGYSAGRRVFQDVPHDVMECSAFSPQNRLSLTDMCQMAVMIDDRKGMKAGYL